MFKIAEVHILGKKQTGNPEIETLQKGMSRKQKKSDVMVKLVDGSWVGFSVKSSANLLVKVVINTRSFNFTRLFISDNISSAARDTT